MGIGVVSLFLDKDAKTVKIPVRIVNGQVKYFYGGDLPKIKNDVIGELILPEYGISDHLFLNISQKEYEREILPEGSIVMVAVNSNNVPDKYREFTEDIITSDLQYNRVFVRVEITEPLRLLCRGSKKAILMETKCKILSLDREASSINNAYTIISEQFEPERRSHTGNVFSKCYWENDSKWFPLEILRVLEESNFEEQLFLDFKVFKLNSSYDKKIVFNEDEELLIAHFSRNEQLCGKKIKEIFNQDKHKYIGAIRSLTDKAVIEEIHNQSY